MKKEHIEVSGLSAVYEIINVQKCIDGMFETNFVLSNRPANFEYIRELRCIQSTITKIRSQEIADITPGEISIFLGEVAKFQQQLSSLLTNDSPSDMFSSKSVCNELFPLIITLKRSLESLYEQSKYNIIKSIENNIRFGNSQLAQNGQDSVAEIRKFRDKINLLSESEFKIQRLKLLEEMITLVAKIEQCEDSSLLESIRILNKGL